MVGRTREVSKVRAATCDQRRGSRKDRDWLPKPSTNADCGCAARQTLDCRGCTMPPAGVLFICPASVRVLPTSRRWKPSQPVHA